MSLGMHSGVSETNRVRHQRTGPIRRASPAALNASNVIVDKFAIVPIAACIFALIVFPLLTFYSPADPRALEGRPETRIFWPAIAAISVLLTAQNRSRLTFPPTSSACSRISRLLEQASCGLSALSVRSSDIFSK